jgi:hypothetical protein
VESGLNPTPNALLIGNFPPVAADLGGSSQVTDWEVTEDLGEELWEEGEDPWT